MPTEIQDESAPLPPALRAHLAVLFPSARVLGARSLGPDAHAEGETGKEIGYGRPIRIALAMRDGSRRDLVLHFSSPDDYGHDRRADRVAAAVLAYDTFSMIPWHAQAIDAGVLRDGTLVSLRDTGEPYLLTEWAEGETYAEDLRRISRSGTTDRDLARVDVLATYLAALHRTPGSHPAAYLRALRDLVGHGEGVAGIADGYEGDAPGAPRARIEAIERECLRWRHRLRDRTSRLRRTHGDFHPFNLLFAENDDTRLTVLDASRGCEGDPADDLAALTINFLFFGLEHRDVWKSGLGRLWDRFWGLYLDASDDRDVLEVIAPFFAWRGLVVASPRWYPNLAPADRDRILRFVERVLAADRFDPRWGPESMA